MYYPHWKRYQYHHKAQKTTMCGNDLPGHVG